MRRLPEETLATDFADSTDSEIGVSRWEGDELGQKERLGPCDEPRTRFNKITDYTDSETGIRVWVGDDWAKERLGSCDVPGGDFNHRFHSLKKMGDRSRGPTSRLFSRNRVTQDELFANLTSWKPHILVHGQIDSFRWLNFALMKAPGSLEQIIVSLGHPLGLH